MQGSAAPSHLFTVSKGQGFEGACVSGSMAQGSVFPVLLGSCSVGAFVISLGLTLAPIKKAVKVFQNSVLSTQRAAISWQALQTSCAASERIPNSACLHLIGAGRQIGSQKLIIGAGNLLCQ